MKDICSGEWGAGGHEGGDVVETYQCRERGLILAIEVADSVGYLFLEGKWLGHEEMSLLN